MRTPDVYSADRIKNWNVQSKSEHGGWFAARPMSWPGINLKRRLSAAWMVFTGKADVLIWHGGEE